MNTLLIVIHIIICVTIIFIVLLQVGRGAEAGAAFGGTGQVHSTRGQATFMGKFTAVMAVAFMLTSFLLTYDTARNAKSSVIDKVSQEAVTRDAPVPATTESTEAADDQATAPAAE